MPNYTVLVGVALLALLSLAIFVYGDGRMAVSTASAESHDAQTRAYVDSAIEYYADKGLTKTVRHYGNPLSWKDRRYLVIADARTHVLVSSPLLYLNGRGVDALVPGGGLGDEIDKATDTGHWFDGVGLNMLSGEREPARYFVKLDDGLAFMSARFSGDLDTPLPDPPTVAEPDDDALTMAYVQKAIDLYNREGLDATVAYYNDIKSVEGERSLIVLRGDDHTVLASVIYGHLVGSNSFTAPGTALGTSIASATSDGYWINNLILINPATGQQGRTRFLVIRRDGLIFGAPHFIVPDEYAKNYVRQAIALYEREGLDATIAFYDSPASIDGEFYLFLIGADDIYLAHPILPHLKGSDIKDVTDSSGYALGVEIAKATEDGHWVEYLWPNPVTKFEEPKSAWVVRHDGLIFATGYYTPDPNAAPPAWKDADPAEYTVTYVEKAIERYDQGGLEALRSYYNSVGSFEGQWYLFATDANDIYVLHPLFSGLIGTDIKDVSDSSGFELGKEIAKATQEGHWVEYLWPHPFTLQEVPKVAYVVRHKGLLFASGYYPEVEDPRAYTRQFVADAVTRYKRDGREGTIAYYNSPESIDGQWFIMMVNELDGMVIANAVFPHLVGTTIPDVGQLGISEEGIWFPPHEVDNPLAPEKNIRQEWAVAHDGIIFVSGYFFSE